MQIRTTLRYHLIPMKMATIKRRMVTSVDKDVEKRTLILCWWKCKMEQLLWKSSLVIFKELNIKLPYGPVIPLLPVYPGENIGLHEFLNLTVHNYIHVAKKKWKQPKGPSTDEQIEYIQGNGINL